MYPRYDLEWSTRVAAKSAQEIAAWREGCAEIIDLMLQRNTQYAAWFDLVDVAVSPFVDALLKTMVERPQGAMFDHVDSGPEMISTLIPVSLWKTSATFLKAVSGPPAP